MISKEHRTSSDPNVELPKLTPKENQHNKRFKVGVTELRIKLTWSKILKCHISVL